MPGVPKASMFKCLFVSRFGNHDSGWSSGDDQQFEPEYDVVFVGTNKHSHADSMRHSLNGHRGSEF